jgi:hypothetical protein
VIQTLGSVAVAAFVCKGWATPFLCGGP